MPTFAPKLRSRLPALAGFAAVALALCIGVQRRGDLTGAWLMLGVPAKAPLFLDTRTITHSIDCVLSGQDPYTVTSFDPWHRTYNYPPIWLDLRYFGVTSRSSNLLGALSAAMTVTTLLLLFRARTKTAGIIVFFAVSSRAVLFAIERGNTDQVIFFLLVFGFFLIEHTRPYLRTPLKGALIVGLSVLKILPIAAAISLIRNRKALLPALAVVILSVAAVVLTTGRRLAMIQANTPSDLPDSFGALPVLEAIFHHTSTSLSALMLQHPLIPTVAALLLSALSLAVGILFREELGPYLPTIDFNQTRGSIAVAGLAIYWLAFVRGASYDYRLIFLLGAIAYLVEDANEAKSYRNLPAAILFILLLSKPTEFKAVYEILDGLVFAVASAWIGTSLLDHLRLPSSGLENLRH